MIHLFLALNFLTYAFDCRSLAPTRCEQAPVRVEEGTAKTWDELTNAAPSLLASIRAEFARLILANVKDPEQKKKMLARVESISIKLDLKSNDGSEGLTDYDKNEISITRGAVTVPSELALAQIAAHEIAHAIDPCTLHRSLGSSGRHPKVVTSTIPTRQITLKSGTKFFVPSYAGFDLAASARALPFGELNECLLRSDSLGAPGTKEHLKSTEESIALGEDQYRSGNNHSINPHCNLGRHVESFCESMSAEVLATLLRSRWKMLSEAHVQGGLKNIVSAICHPPNVMRGNPPMLEAHPSTNERIARILLAQPTIRARAGCQDELKFRYCGYDRPSRSSSPAMPETAH